MIKELLLRYLNIMTFFALSLAQGSNETYTEESFIEAISREDESSVVAHLRYGINPNAVLKNGNTALIYASKTQSVVIVRMLINAGAKVRHRNMEGHTALTIAIQFGRAGVIGELIKRGAPVNPIDSVSEIPLHLAFDEPKIKHNRLEVIEVLLKHGAKPNIKTRTPPHRTPLMRSASLGDIETLRLLLRSKAKVNLLDDAGESALFRAVHSRCEKCVEELIRAGSDVRIRNKKGESLLQLAIRSRNKTATARLIRAGGNPNEKNKNGTTLLMFAVLQNDLAIVKTLLKAGARIHPKDRVGHDALSLAHMKGFDEIANLLARQN